MTAAMVTQPRGEMKTVQVVRFNQGNLWTHPTHLQPLGFRATQTWDVKRPYPDLCIRLQRLDPGLTLLRTRGKLYACAYKLNRTPRPVSRVFTALGGSYKLKLCPSSLFFVGFVLSLWLGRIQTVYLLVLGAGSLTGPPAKCRLSL